MMKTCKKIPWVMCKHCIGYIRHVCVSICLGIHSCMKTYTIVNFVLKQSSVTLSCMKVKDFFLLPKDTVGLLQKMRFYALNGYDV